jgi:hypothetical protein
MGYLALVLIGLAIGCTSVNVDQKLNELGITRTESKNFLKAVVALDAACKQSDSTSIQACQFYNDQSRSIPNVEQFLKTSLFAPDALNSAERPVFNNITLIGAVYREYVEAKQAKADSDRFWNSAAAGAAFGSLFSRPAQPNCQILNPHTASPSVYCQ